MPFKINDCQQLTLEDSFISLTGREKKALENGECKLGEVKPNNCKDYPYIKQPRKTV
jgi:hypothetical protein